MWFELGKLFLNVFINSGISPTLVSTVPALTAPIDACQAVATELAADPVAVNSIAPNAGTVQKHRTETVVPTI